jgi:hypothetical protein
MLTRQQLADAIGKDLRTIGRAIAKLQQAGSLHRVGSDKAGHWGFTRERLQDEASRIATPRFFNSTCTNGSIPCSSICSCL